MKKIIAHIALSLVLGCSMMSFGMDRKEPWISQGQLIKYSYSRSEHRPLNKKDPQAGTDNMTAIYDNCTLKMDIDNKLYIESADNKLPIKDVISVNKLHSLKILSLPGTGVDQSSNALANNYLKALDDCGNEYIIRAIEIPWDKLPPINKTVSVSAKLVSGPTSITGVPYQNVTMTFSSTGNHSFKYLKENDKKAKKWFIRETLPLTPDDLTMLASSQSTREEVLLQIHDKETGKTTILQITEVKGDAKDILAYNDQKTVEGTQETDSTPSSILHNTPTKSLQSQSSKGLEDQSYKKIFTQMYTAITKKISDHPFAAFTALGGIVLLVIAHYTDYLHNIDITQMFNKFVSTKKS